MQGKFGETLIKNNEDIKRSRAKSLYTDAETAYRRIIEDLSTNKRKLELERENLLDFGSAEGSSLVKADTFMGSQYADKDITIGVQLRNLDIAIEIAKERYEKLFNA